MSWAQKQIQARERQAQAYELMCKGKTYQFIADEVGYCNNRNAWRAVRSHKRRLQSTLLKADADAAKEDILSQLNQIQELLADRVEGGGQARDLLKTVEMKIKLLGLDQQKIDITTDGNPIKFVALPEDSI